MTLKQKTCDEIKQIIHDKHLIDYQVVAIVPSKHAKAKRKINHLINLKVF